MKAPELGLLGSGATGEIISSMAPWAPVIQELLKKAKVWNHTTLAGGMALLNDEYQGNLADQGNSLWSKEAGFTLKTFLQKVCVLDRQTLGV